MAIDLRDSSLIPEITGTIVSDTSESDSPGTDLLLYSQIEQYKSSRPMYEWEVEKIKFNEALDEVFPNWKDYMSSASGGNQSSWSKEDDCFLIVPEIWYISKIKLLPEEKESFPDVPRDEIRKPFAHQLASFREFRDADSFGLFFEQGTGKTKAVIDIDVSNYLHEKISAILVIAPNSVHNQWEEQQFPLHCAIPYESYIWEGTPVTYNQKRDINRFFKMSSDSKLKVFFVNVEAFQGDSILPWVAKFVRDEAPSIILDESSFIKNGQAKRSKRIRRLNEYGKRRILTGTPAPKSPVNLWSQFDFLVKDFFGPSESLFQSQHTFRVKSHKRSKRMSFQDAEEIKDTVEMFKDRIAKHIAAGTVGKIRSTDPFECTAQYLNLSVHDVQMIANQDEYTSTKDMQDILDKIDPYVLKVKKEDCLDLIPKVYQRLDVDMSERQHKIYLDMVETMVIDTEEGGSVKALGVFSHIMRLMQITGGSLPVNLGKDEHGMTEYTARAIDDPITSNVKIAALLEHLEENVDDQSFIVWGFFKNEIAMIREAIMNHTNYTWCLVQGGMHQDERKEVISNFETGKSQCLIANSQSKINYGKNWQHCTLQYFYSNSFRVVDRIQAEDRTHRSGQKGTCVYTDIVCRNSIDQKVLKAIKAGKDLNDLVTEQNFMEFV